MRAYWDESTTREVTSVAELAEVRMEVAAMGLPTMLFLQHENGCLLVVGLGADESVLTFVEADGTSFHSVGDLARTGFLQFWCRGQLDDFSAEMAVPSMVVPSAMDEFLAGGTQPSCARWEADW